MREFYDAISYSKIANAAHEFAGLCANGKPAFENVAVSQFSYNSQARKANRAAELLHTILAKTINSKIQKANFALVEFFLPVHMKVGGSALKTCQKGFYS